MKEWAILSRCQTETRLKGFSPKRGKRLYDRIVKVMKIVLVVIKRHLTNDAILAF